MEHIYFITIDGEKSHIYRFTPIDIIPTGITEVPGVGRLSNVDGMLSFYVSPNESPLSPPFRGEYRPEGNYFQSPPEFGPHRVPYGGGVSPAPYASKTGLIEAFNGYKKVWEPGYHLHPIELHTEGLILPALHIYYKTWGEGNLIVNNNDFYSESKGIFMPSDGGRTEILNLSFAHNEDKIKLSQDHEDDHYRDLDNLLEDYRENCGDLPSILKGLEVKSVG